VAETSAVILQQQQQCYGIKKQPCQHHSTKEQCHDSKKQCHNNINNDTVIARTPTTACQQEQHCHQSHKNNNAAATATMPMPCNKNNNTNAVTRTTVPMS